MRKCRTLGSVVLVVTLLGCTPSSDGPTAATSDEQRAIAVCLETRGLPADPPADPVPEEWARANLECAVDAGIDLPYDEPEELQAASASAHLFVRCMRNLGWDIEDPVRSDFADFMKPPSIEIDNARVEEQRTDISDCEASAYGSSAIFVADGEEESDQE